MTGETVNLDVSAEVEAGAEEILRSAAADEDPADAANPALDRARAEHLLEQQLEALLLVADEPISAVGLATATDRPVREVRRALQALVADYDGVGAQGQRVRGFELREVAGGYRFYVR